MNRKKNKNDSKGYGTIATETLLSVALGIAATTILFLIWFYHEDKKACLKMPDSYYSYMTGCDVQVDDGIWQHVTPEELHGNH